MKTLIQFPPNFFWGAATSSHQIEGSPALEGLGESVWEMFCRRSGKVQDGSNALIACDHVNRYPEDVALMKQIGLQAYRFSVAWPRVLPGGTGQVSSKGLGFYDRLVDELLGAGIAPWVTLYHWDLPVELYYRGGWLNRDSADWFADYTCAVVDRLSDRVQNWFTLNEPQVFIWLAMREGVHAPGDKLGWNEVIRAGHHAMLAHGKAVQTIRAYAKKPPKVGYAPVGITYRPATDSAADLEATKRAFFGMGHRTLWCNAWWMDPVFNGHYPEDGLKIFHPFAPPIQNGDLETIHQPLDFFGANIYHAQTIRSGPDGRPEVVPSPQGTARTLMGWDVVPEALYYGPKLFYDRYKLPVVVTENGMSNTDTLSADGRVHDDARIEFTRAYLEQYARAAQDGADLAGYFHWSLMDNFEWDRGYTQRFGLIHVDYQTQKRTLKESAHWYGRLIATHGRSLNPPVEVG
ncbi:MAG: GH1 family beta-glucosidase [Meiothermus sp.]|nr:GH1 family beta-glucosidase [Meiothermus sp.]